MKKNHINYLKYFMLLLKISQKFSQLRPISLNFKNDFHK